MFCILLLSTQVCGHFRIFFANTNTKHNCSLYSTHLCVCVEVGGGGEVQINMTALCNCTPSTYVMLSYSIRLQLPENKLLSLSTFTNKLALIILLTINLC